MAVEQAGLNWSEVPVLFLAHEDEQKAEAGLKQLLLRYPATAPGFPGMLSPEALMLTGWDETFPNAEPEGLSPYQAPCSVEA